jgi:Ca2+-binding EF-hand superfamily protein
LAQIVKLDYSPQQIANTIKLVDPKNANQIPFETICKIVAPLLHRKDIYRRQEAETRPILRKLFTDYDADSSGALDTNEMKRLMTDICEILDISISANQLVYIMKHIDQDGDGLVTFDELFKMLSPIVILQRRRLKTDVNPTDANTAKLMKTDYE